MKQPLEPNVTFIKSVSSHGTNGFTSETPITFQRLNNASYDFWDL